MIKNEEDDDEDLKIFYADFENFFFLKNFFIRWGKFSEPKVFEILATFATVQTNFLSKWLIIVDRLVLRRNLFLTRDPFAQKWTLRRK